MLFSFSLHSGSSNICLEVILVVRYTWAAVTSGLGGHVMCSLHADCSPSCLLCSAARCLQSQVISEFVCNVHCVSTASMTLMRLC